MQYTYNVRRQMFAAVGLPSVRSGQCVLHARMLLCGHSQPALSITFPLFGCLKSPLSYNNMNTTGGHDYKIMATGYSEAVGFVAGVLCDKIRTV